MTASPTASSVMKFVPSWPITEVPLVTSRPLPRCRVGRSAAADDAAVADEDDPASPLRSRVFFFFFFFFFDAFDLRSTATPPRRKRPRPTAPL
jgi:hypothetical protein